VVDTNSHADECSTLHCPLLYGVAGPIFTNGILVIDIYNPKKISSESIGNLTKLSSTLGVPREEIEEALKLPADERYRAQETPKSDGSLRKVYSPHFLIRKIQRKINTRILSDPNIISWPNHIFGSIPNRDVDECNV